MKTLGVKVGDDEYDHFVVNCRKRGITVSDRLRELVENGDKPSESINLDRIIEHIKYCGRCIDGLADRGYFLISAKQLKKHNLIVERNPIYFQYDHSQSSECIF